MSRYPRVMYDEPDVEILQYTDRDEAIEGILDERVEDPETIKVSKYRRNVATIRPFDEGVLVTLLECLDEHYCLSADEQVNDVTPRMRKAAQRFVGEVLKEYCVYDCALVETETINVAKWRQK